jgi:AAA family ATP:ADP antiporter
MQPSRSIHAWSGRRSPEGTLVRPVLEEGLEVAGAGAAARITRGHLAAPGGLARALSVLAPVRPGEGPVALLLLLCVFALLCAYYLLKTAREGLILSGGMLGLRGDELKIYATGAMALLLVGIVPAYGALASRVGRMRLIDVSYGIVLACLAGFFALARAGVPIGLAFFLWLGLVNWFLVAQFWSYANDLYTEEQGKRLFALVALGGAAGAIAGPRLAHLAGTHELLLAAGALLAGVLGLFHLIERRQPARGARRAEPIGGAGGFALVRRDGYLAWIAALVVVATLVNSIGEFTSPASSPRRSWCRA